MYKTRLLERSRLVAFPRRGVCRAVVAGLSGRLETCNPKTVESAACKLNKQTSKSANCVRHQQPCFLVIRNCNKFLNLNSNFCESFGRLSNSPGGMKN